MINHLFALALPGLEALLAAIASYLMFRATAWVNAHAKNAQINGILMRLIETSQVVVQEVEQTVVAKMTNGGPLNGEQAREALDAALEKLREHLGPKGIAELEQIVRPGQLNQILISYIESAVHEVNLDAPVRGEVLSTVAEVAA